MHNDRRWLSLAWVIWLGTAACTERVPTSPSTDGQPTPGATTAGCSYEISPITRDHGVGGESGSVNVTTSSTCGWTVGSSAPWLTFTPASSAGNGIVTYSVAANDGRRREGRLAIADRSFLAVQAGSDSVRLSPPSVSVSPIGQFTTITVTIDAGLSWSATSSVGWLTFTGASSGTGPGAFSLRAETNPGTTARSATVTVTGPVNAATVTVTQAGRVPQPSPYDGQWTGNGTGTSTASTPARADVTFDVVDGVISFIRVDFTIDTAPGTPQASSCRSTTNSSVLRLVNDSFSSTFGSFYRISISGRFTSSGASSGTIQVVPGTVAQTQPWCLGATMSWTATKR